MNFCITENTFWLGKPFGSMIDGTKPFNTRYCWINVLTLANLFFTFSYLEHSGPNERGVVNVTISIKLEDNHSLLSAYELDVLYLRSSFLSLVFGFLLLCNKNVSLCSIEQHLYCICVTGLFAFAWHTNETSIALYRESNNKVRSVLKEVISCYFQSVLQWLFTVASIRSVTSYMTYSYQTYCTVIPKKQTSYGLVAHSQGTEELWMKSNPVAPRLIRYRFCLMTCSWANTGPTERLRY